MKCNYLLILVSLFCVTEGKLPASFLKCKYDTNYNECLKAAIPDALIKMENGLPELGALPLEPLTIPSISIGGNFAQIYHDMKIYNITSLKFEDVDANISAKAFTANATIFVPEIKVIADYHFKGEALLLNFDGKGLSTTILENTKMKIHINAESYEKKSKSYYKVKEFTFSMEPKKAIFSFENLFGENKQLTDETNRSFNENWKYLFDSIKLSYEEAFATVFKAYASNIYSRIEVRELFIQ